MWLMSLEDFFQNIRFAIPCTLSNITKGSFSFYICQCVLFYLNGYKRVSWYMLIDGATSECFSVNFGPFTTFGF